MGTRFELVLHGRDALALRGAGELALQRIAEEEARLSLFRRDSLVSHLNREAPRTAVRVDDELLDLFEACDRLHAATKGSFDPAIGAWMAAAGFRDSEQARPDFPAAPWSFVDWDRETRTVRFHHPQVQLDFGAIGKGWALDQATETLREEGIECALLHGGTSTAVAIGAPPEREGWGIAIRDPRAEQPTLETVCLRDAALSVSAPHGRAVEAGGETRGHVLDPRRGHSVTTRLAAAVADRATAADAWSTALLVMAKVPEEHGLRRALVIS